MNYYRIALLGYLILVLVAVTVAVAFVGSVFFDYCPAPGARFYAPQPGAWWDI